MLGRGLAALIKGIPFIAKAAPAAAAAVPKLGVLGNVGRFAGSAKNFLIPADMKGGQLAMQLVPDAIFGIGAAASAGPEADIFDRVGIGLGSTLGGSVGGLTAGGIGRKLKRGQMTQGLMDMGGSYVGDMVGMNAGLGATRVKESLMGNEALDPYQRMSIAQHQQMEEEMKRRLMAGYGMLPGTPYDPFMYNNGLG
mgnify:CR=1 FL=1|tara:strand:+ start:2976 stop:3563 length:588 start_codon:yes stop_codon:yes gene_type:complete